MRAFREFVHKHFLPQESRKELNRSLSDFVDDLMKAFVDVFDLLRIRNPFESCEKYLSTNRSETADFLGVPSMLVRHDRHASAFAIDWRYHDFFILKQKISYRISWFVHNIRLHGNVKICQRTRPCLQFLILPL